MEKVGEKWIKLHWLKYRVELVLNEIIQLGAYRGKMI